MKIFIASGAPLDGSLYIEEILHLFAPPCVERAALSDALQQAESDLVILPCGSSDNGVEDFLRSGGSVIAIRPRDSIVALAGLKSAGERDRPGRLRIVAPICYAARGEALWTLGAQTVYSSELSVEESAASTLAYLFEPNNPDSESAGIFQRPVGDGVLTVFAYDPALCIARLRQGFPERAGVLPPGESVPRSTYLHEPNAPNDTHFRPTADLHALALCDVVSELLQRSAPVPKLWHLPGGAKSVLLFTGDEDGAAQDMNRLEMQEVESYDVAMSLYVIPDSTSISVQDVTEYSVRGHEISVHPDLWPVAGQSVSEQLHKAQADVEKFRDTFAQPVKTIRNHSGIWPGYLDLPELWEKLQIEMDASCLTSLLLQSRDDGPYVHGNAAMPLRFVREEGTLIDVLQQHTHVSDDLSFHPTVGYSQKYSAAQSEWFIERTLEDAALHFHVPFCVIIHPSNYVTFSGDQGKAYLRIAQKLHLPIWTLERWNNFCRARESWSMSTLAWDGAQLSFSLAGKLCEDLTLTLPATFDGRALNSLSLDETETKFEIVERFGKIIGQAVLPEGTQEISVVASYS